jgi:Ca2+-binding EF-hand superfamily protein
MIIMV